MTPEQADQVISLLTQANEQLSVARWLLHATWYTLCAILGVFLWRMAVLAKNERHWW